MATFGCPWVDYQFDWDACGSHDYSVWYDNNGNHYGSGVPCCVPHSWGLPGNYCVKARSKPPCGHISDWSDPHYITITGENEAPDTPDITGPTSGTAGEEYEYSFITTDPNGDDVYYYIDWGDNQTEEWIGPYESSEEVKVSHTWDEEGTYALKAKAKDIYNAESDWGTLEIEMPKNQLRNNPLFLQFLERLMDRFPLLEHIFYQFTT